MGEIIDMRICLAEQPIRVIPLTSGLSGQFNNQGQKQSLEIVTQPLSKG